MPLNQWLPIAISGAGFTLALVIAILKLHGLFFATKAEVASHQQATAEALSRLKEDYGTKITDARTAARDALTKAIDERRRDAESMAAMIRADANERFEATEARIMAAIKESKDDRKAGESALFAKIDELSRMVLKPRSGDTAAIHRSQV